jgi:hypothetical protein
MDIHYVRSTFERKVRAKNVGISLLMLVLVLVLVLVLMLLLVLVLLLYTVDEATRRKKLGLLLHVMTLLYVILYHESLIFLMNARKEDL